ncbi:MAG: hypothetical protein QM783_19870 [Phycisphaerales bacterium]
MRLRSGARIAQQAFGVGINWNKFAWIAPSAAVVLAAVGAFLRPVSKQKVARVVDEGGDLKESLSTALTVEGSNDAWAVNVMETAQRAARGVRVSQAVPVRAPGYWPTPLALALAFAAVWFVMPKMDLFGREAAEEQKKADAQAMTAAKEETKVAVQTAQKKLEDAAKKFGDENAEASKPEKIEKALTPEEARTAGIKQLTSMKEQLEKMKLSEKAQKADAMLDKMKSLRRPGDGPLDKFAQNLAQGKMGEATDALDELAKQMANGEMKPEDAAKVKSQLENLQKQLEKIAADKKKLEDQLAKAGLDPKLANSPEALKQALEKKDGMSKEQKQAMENAAKAQESACQACQSMAQACQNASQSMSKDGKMGQKGAQAMQDMQNQMSQMEMAEADMKSLQAAMSECQNASQQMSEGMGQCNNPGEGECKGGNGNGQCEGDPNGNKPFANGETDNKGGYGRGGPGISQGGGGAGEQQDIEKWNQRKVRTALGEGPMIGTMLVQGEQIKGESRQQFQNLAAAAEQQATAAMNNNQVPREHRDAVKHYFSTVSAKAKAPEGGLTPNATPATPAPAGTTPAKSADKK